MKARRQVGTVNHIWPAHPLDYGEGHVRIAVSFGDCTGVHAVVPAALGIKVGDEAWFRTRDGLSRFIRVKKRK